MKDQKKDHRIPLIDHRCQIQPQMARILAQVRRSRHEQDQKAHPRGHLRNHPTGKTQNILLSKARALDAVKTLYSSNNYMKVKLAFSAPLAPCAKMGKSGDPGAKYRVKVIVIGASGHALCLKS